ncbi:sugar phosphate isomerase/epimerase family protein [Acidicapsa dinghuensis]|uniref:Sugar phosphate isomerase/epimerase family protein n=1 Tax=Acidicapsa dinghuensis TaxID=2218256 RepID=A0ABW1EC44_9BACT|nr:sugar phosphate isomerase/epimerase [Acidicapsa dinghuensis]
MRNATVTDAVKMDAMNLQATSRRGFLRTGAMAAAAACALGSDGLSLKAGAMSGMAKSEGKPKIRLGVCSYSFHELDRAHVIEGMKQLNVKWLNAKDAKDHLPMSPPSATLEAVAAYKAAGIELTSAGVIYFQKKDSADIRAKFDYAQRAGVSLIIGAPTREVLPDVESFVKEYDMRLAIHNHGPEDKEWPSPLDVLKAVEHMDKRIGLCIDVGHTERAGTDPIEAIHKAGPRLFDLHMKDLADLKVKESQVAVGDGKIPIRGIFEALHAIGYNGYADLEYEIHADDPLPGMIKSFAYMRGVLNGMGYED